ncbi:MAG: hypothetical protein SWE60_11840 [Thermodesulfobacteriota bacterium]|nr:hypothetical protein [Thermodesulfobacteriota bacterium]
MTSPVSVGQLAHEIRLVCESDKSEAERLVEAYLEKQLHGFSAGERLVLMEKLAGEFDRAGPSSSLCTGLDEEVLLGLFSLLLGRRVCHADLSSAQLLERLAESLNTIFNTLNELVSVINATLMGRDTGEETIRRVIGFHLEGEDQTKSLETYLGQIKKAFLVTQEAFKKAAHKKVSDILAELDPERIQATGGGRLKFGPLRKAESFDTYEEKFRMCKKWFDTGRFTEEFMREFEKKAQQFSAQ